jgi:MHS family proline/betaine transporter-like MFS transporter
MSSARKLTSPGESAREVATAPPEKQVAHELSTGDVLRKILPAAGGSFIEWYEFAIYSYVSSYITENFFADGRGGSLGTWAGFAVTFACRPLGGALFGYMSDTLGRKPAMQLTIALMLVTTIAQGCLPSFAAGESWGWFGLTMLIICRALQGLSAGGELATAAVYISEVSPARTLGFNLSWISVSGAFGAWVVAALVVFILESVLDHDAMLTWGWRVPYLTSVLPGGVVIFARRYLEETEDFEALVNDVVRERAAKEASAAAEEGRSKEAAVDSAAGAEKAAVPAAPFWEVMKNHKLAVIVGSLGTAGIGSMWYVVPVYGVFFLQEYGDIKPNEATLSAMVGFLIPTILAPFVGMLVDRWGAFRTHTLALFFGSVWAPVPLFYWWTHVAQDQATASVFIGQCLVGLLLALTTSVYLWVVELFPVHVRGTGVSVAYNIGIGIFGGVGPLISDALNKVVSPRSVIDAPAAYTIFTGIVSLCAVAASRVLEKKGMMKLTHIRASPY